MDGGDELRSEHIGEIGGNGREAASIHGGNDAKCGNEKRYRLPVRGERRHCIQGRAKSEEDDIRALAPDLVGERAPDDAAENVEERDETYEARSDRRGYHCLLTVELIESDLRITHRHAPE